MRLRPLCEELELLNVQLRKAQEKVGQGILDALVQDMLLNTCDGCYSILYDLERQILQNEEPANPEPRDNLLWAEDRIKWRAETIRVYAQGLAALNANIAG